MTIRTSARLARPFRRIIAAFGVAAQAWLAGCASAPLPPPVISYETKLSWILRLEDRRVIREEAPPAAPGTNGGLAVAPVPGPIPDLVRLLGDEEARVRRRAALALGRVGLRDAVVPLVDRLSADDEPEVRQMAAFALGLLGDATAADALASALSDPSPLVQGRAAEALGRIGDEAAAPAIAAMVAAGIAAGELAGLPPDELAYPLDPAIEAIRLGIYALVRLDDFDALSAAVLDDLGQPLTDWWPAAFALQRTADEGAVRALRALARTDTVYTRAYAIRGLGEIGDQGAASLILPLLSDPSLSVPITVEAIRAAGRLKLSAAAQPLGRLAFDGALPGRLRAEAVRALAGTGAGEARGGLLDLISDANLSVRMAVFGTLATLDPDGFIIVLSGLEPDPQWRVRAALASALAALPVEVAGPRLEGMLDDEDQRVVPAVLNALTAVGAPELASILTERLTADDPVVRMAAAANLGELRPPGAESALIEAYRFGERDTTYVARAAALAALAAYGAGAATETLTAALADRDWAVRVRAAALLASLDRSADPADAIRPAPSRHAARFFEDPALTAPSVSPHVFIETDKGTIEIELAVLDAPLTASNFMTLAREGFYDGLTFHRVVPNFVVQGGDPRGDGEGGAGYTIRDEINERPYLRGQVGVPLDWADTGGSQFFITESPQPQLDGRYTVFGHVVSGIDVVDRLEAGDVMRRVRVWDGVVP